MFLSCTAPIMWINFVGVYRKFVNKKVYNGGANTMFVYLPVIACPTVWPIADPIATPPAVAAICPKRPGDWGAAAVGAAGAGAGAAGGALAGRLEL